MSLFTRGLMYEKEVKFNSSNRMATLNPNAAEFIPSSFRSTIANTKNEDATRPDVGKAVLDQSESNVSNSSDDEVHQFWRRQLPDDITPDFKFMAQDELQGHGKLSLEGLSINDGTETSRFSASAVRESLGAQHDVFSLADKNFSSSEELGYSGLTCAENQSFAAFMTSAANSWDKQFTNGDQYFTNEMVGRQFSRDPNACFINDLLVDDSVTTDSAMNPIEFLASQFPGFAADSLADVYYANECDLNLTIEILTQLELQVEVDGGFNQNLNSKSLAAPSFNAMDFPALPVTDAQNGLPKYTGEDLQQASNTYRSSSNISRGATDFASTVRKLASQESGRLNYERNGSANASLGVNRSSQLQSSPFNGHERTSGAARAAPLWLETGEAVANIYSESREEARDFARIRNACFEQARQAYLIGNKALAKELSVKGQLYNMKMKEAHGKARETIYRQRPPCCLVPGAGLGRLALEISCLGFSSQGNEFSYYMMICSNFILNHTQMAGEWTIYPWIHSNCNSFSDSDQLRPVSFPDIHPASAGITEGFSMCGGDFVEVYNDVSQEASWDAVVTCFFLDTAHNIVEYIEIISKILKDGGVWINLGPLLYHFADTYGTNDELSIELSLEDVKNIALHYGFELEVEKIIETTYTTNPRSMMQNRYFAAFWTMKKRPKA